MDHIEIECAHCSLTTQAPAIALLVDVGGSVSDETFGGTVNWICKGCTNLVSQPVKWPQLLLLVNVGAQLYDEYEDPRPEHPERLPAGAPFTEEDALDLHALLQRTSWFDQLVAWIDASSVERPRA